MQRYIAIEGNQRALGELKAVLEIIDDSEFTAKTAPFQGTPGMHCRHIIQHYQNLFTGLQQGNICYDNRSRQSLLETDRTYALDALQQELTALTSLREPSIATPPLTLKVKVHCDSDDADISQSTTLVRELLFLQSHTIHHLALLRAMLVQMGFTIPEQTGIAPATRHYQMQEA